MEVFFSPYPRIEIPSHYLHIYSQTSYHMNYTVRFFSSQFAQIASHFREHWVAHSSKIPQISLKLFYTLNIFILFSLTKRAKFWLQSNSLTSQRNKDGPIFWLLIIFQMHPNVSRAFFIILIFVFLTLAFVPFFFSP